MDSKRGPKAFRMDDNIEKKEENIEGEGVAKETQEKDKVQKVAEALAVVDQRKAKARQAFDEENKRKEARGEQITEEEKEIQRQMVERGLGPVGGGSGDGYFENFPVGKYENDSSLKDFALEVKRLGENNQITEDKLQEISQRVREMVGAGITPDDRGDEFIEDISRIRVARDTSQAPTVEQTQQPNVLVGDGNFENINIELFRGTELEPLAQQIQNIGRAGVSPQPRMINQWMGQAQQLLAGNKITPEEYQRFDREIQGLVATQAAEQQGRRLEGGRSNTPQSIQEVALWIIKNEGDEWGPDGPNALLDSLDIEKAKFNKANFLKWVRERMLFYDSFSPDDPNLNLLGAVGFETEFRTIGLGAMINNKKQYFKDSHEKDENGHFKVYDEFAEDIVNEIFLFSTSRGFDAEYRFTMWSDEELPKLLAKQHQRSIFTSSEQMKKIFKFSADYGVKDEYGKEDTKVGDSIRKAYEVYYYMSDFDKLKEVLGPDSPFFTRVGFEDALRLSQNKESNWEIPENYKKLFDKLFDQSGKAAPAEFIKYVNLFNETGKLQSTVSLVREAVRLAVSDIYGLESGIDIEPVNDNEKKRRATRRKNLEYSERWAYSMARWTGAAARNDTDAIGYDAQTKAMRFQQYRVRQSDAGRGGAFGNEYDLPVLKNLTLDFFNGIFVETEQGGKDLTPFEVFQQLDQYDNRMMAIRRGRDDASLSDQERQQIATLIEEKDSMYDKLKFKQFTELDYASNHLGRAWGIFHRVMGAEELQIDQIVKHEPFRGLVFDKGKFEEQVKEGFIKPIRYAFNTYSNIDFSKKMRVQTNAGKGGIPQYKEVTIAEAMFGPAVLQEYYTGRGKNRRINEEKLVKDRKDIYKKVVRAMIASHLRAHRQYASGYNHIGKEGIDKFYEALESIRQIEIEEEEGGDVTVKRTKHFFSEDDMKWMKKYSKTESWRMHITDNGAGLLGALFKGLGEGFGDMFKDGLKG